MDPAQGETGGKSLTAKLKAKSPRVKDKVKSLKYRLPGMKKHTGEEEDSSEYDDNSPRGPGPETGYNVGESTPVSTVKTDSPPSPRGYVSRPSEYDTQNPGYVAGPPPTRLAPVADSPRSNLAPSFEEKFNYLNVGEKSPRYQPEQQTHPIRSYQPEQQTDPIRSYQSEQQTDALRSYQPEQQTDPIRSYQPEQQTDSMRSYQPAQQIDPIRSYQPENQQYSPSTTESMQKGYSDVSYRARPTTPNKGMLDKVRESVTGAAVVLGDKVGYYNDTPAAPRDPNAPSILEKAKSTLGLDKPRDPNAPSLVDKTKATLGLDKPRDPNAPTLVDKTKATLGLDKPRDPNAPPLTEKAKAYASVASQKTREYGATAADRAAWTKDRLAAQTTPTHHDKALSEQVTQTLSTLPGVIREKVFGPTSPTAATTSPRSPGVVDRVSGAVSSFFNTAPKQTAERLQHTFPAHSDYPAAHAPQNSADRGSAEAATSYAPPSYPTESATSHAPPSYETVPATSRAPPSYPTGNL